MATQSWPQKLALENVDKVQKEDLQIIKSHSTYSAAKCVA